MEAERGSELAGSIQVHVLMRPVSLVVYSKRRQNLQMGKSKDAMNGFIGVFRY